MDSFLRVPDSVLVIAQNIDILHRLDAAFFRVGEARGGLLVKFYAGEEHSEEELLLDFEQNGLQAWRLKRQGRLLMRAEEEPLGGSRWKLVDARQLVVKTAAIEEAIEEWGVSQLRRVQSMHSAIILASEEQLSLSHATPMPPS